MKSAIRLFRYLHGMHFENYSRARAAAACECSEATVKRALGFLVFNKALRRKRGGRSTSSKLMPLMKLSEFLTHYPEMTHYVPRSDPLSSQNDPLSGPALRNARASERKLQKQEKGAATFPDGFAEGLRRGMEDAGVGAGTEEFMGRVLEIARGANIPARPAGAILAILARQKRFRNASERYLLAAFKGELQRQGNARRVA